MRNFSIGTKMMGGFIIVSLIATIVGVWGIFRMTQISRLDTELYKNVTKPLGEIGHIADAYQQTRVELGEIMIESYNYKDASAYEKRLEELDKTIAASLKVFEKSIIDRESQDEFVHVSEGLKKYAPIRARAIQLAKDGQSGEALALLRGEGGVVAKQIEDGINKLVQATTAGAKRRSDQNASTAKGSITITIILTILGAAVSILSGIFLSRSITVPVNRVIAGLSEGANQVAAAAGEVSGASQSLAEGSSQQAAALEETSASIEELSSMTAQNAENAKEANTMMEDTSRVVAEVDNAMQELKQAMKNISVGSEDMAKIIKTIDEIAFQTNLLALNAAVEAARAGEAGAGFAVVADEVRNLAMRSAESAKNTSDLIQESIKRVKQGSEIVTKTEDAFDRVLKGANKVKDLIGEIAAASGEQAHGISQISKAVAEMDKVVQQNASHAEESASAAEELNAQVMGIKGFVGEMILVVRGGDRTYSAETLSNNEVKQKHSLLSM